MSEDYYGKAEKMELTAQFILGAVIQHKGTTRDPGEMVRYAWDVAEVFQVERDARVAKFRNEKSQ